MKKEPNSRYFELEACQEASNLLKVEILRQLRLLISDENVKALKTTDTNQTMFDFLTSSDPNFLVQFNTENICKFIQNNPGVNRLISFADMPSQSALNALTNELATFNLVNQIGYRIGNIIFDSKGVETKKAAEVEKTFNSIIIESHNKSILQHNNTIKPTGFFQYCKAAWYRLLGIKMNSASRFFNPEEKIAQNKADQLAAKNTPQPSPYKPSTIK